MVTLDILVVRLLVGVGVNKAGPGKNNSFIVSLLKVWYLYLYSVCMYAYVCVCVCVHVHARIYII